MFPDYVKEHGPIPDLPAWLGIVVAAEATLGHDQNGTPLRSEQEAFFRRYRIVDEQEQELWELMWSVLAAERAHVLAERMDRTRPPSS